MSDIIFEINSYQILFCLKLIFSTELGLQTQFCGKKKQYLLKKTGNY
jgi:hypothetical protein